MTTEDLLSLLQFNRRWATHTLPLGDGAIETGDKQHLLGLYSGSSDVATVATTGWAFTAFSGNKGHCAFDSQQ